VNHGFLKGDTQSIRKGLCQISFDHLKLNKKTKIKAELDSHKIQSDHFLIRFFIQDGCQDVSQDISPVEVESSEFTLFYKRSEKKIMFS